MDFANEADIGAKAKGERLEHDYCCKRDVDHHVEVHRKGM